MEQYPTVQASILLYRLVEGDDLQERLLARHHNTAAQNEKQALTLTAQLMDVSGLQHTCEVHTS